MKKLADRLKITTIFFRSVEWMAGEQQRRTRLRRISQIERARKGGKRKQDD